MNEALAGAALGLVERGLVPDALVRAGIRHLCRQRLRDLAGREREHPGGGTGRFLAEMAAGPVAPVPGQANNQHYELPAEFFRLVLGPHLKYSACWWPDGVDTLAGAEAAALALTAERAGIADGMRVLELGCGWGSLTLWMAERFPRAEITAVSNSAGQRRHILAAAAARGLANLRVITADMNHYQADGRYDRIVSVEMFEHMRNWSVLLGRIRTWLEADGRLFLHVFCHRRWPYAFETGGAGNWMGRHFFTGGLMPSVDLVGRIDRDLHVRDQWALDGTHYRRTAQAWLDNLDARRREVMPVLRSAYGPEATRWFHRWRVFFLACAELFGYAGGREWMVGHYLLEPVARPARRDLPAAAVR